MIDLVKLIIRGGNGGNGSGTFRKEKHTPRGGPAGGDGGRGGNVYIVREETIFSLDHLKGKRVIRAGDGKAGNSGKRTGAAGVDELILVPPGTVVWELGQERMKTFIGDVEALPRQLIARGGQGGSGNARKATPVNQIPLLAEQGGKGQSLSLLLELKLDIDIAVLGFPNSGKSSLLAAYSSARPKVADYPFTTRVPAVGTLQDGWRRFTMVEIPGIVEGASEGRGLGNGFLRHAERAKILVILLDGTSEQLETDYTTIIRELEKYDTGVANKGRVIVVSKGDLPNASKKIEEIKPTLSNASLIPLTVISTVTKEGITSLRAQLLKQLDTVPAPPLGSTDTLLQIEKTHQEEPKIVKEKNTFVVHYSRAERLAALADIKDWRVRMQLRRELKRMGVTKILEEAHIAAGDTVRLGQVEMEW